MSNNTTVLDKYVRAYPLQEADRIHLGMTLRDAVGDAVLFQRNK